MHNLLKFPDLPADCKQLFISFSGGETSGYMTYTLLSQVRAYNYFLNKRSIPLEIAQPIEVVVVFANTGEEREETLDFVKRCDEAFDFQTVWVEAIVPPTKAEGEVFAKVVSYSTASRKGEPFESMIKRYGIPNISFPHCTRVLKTQTMRAYVRNQLGWKRGKSGYYTAIGIRADEFDRQSKRAEAEKLIYPLIGWNISKPDIDAFWRSQDFRLELQTHEGNCKWCWKKSIGKLTRLAKENPQLFDFPRRMERDYQFYRPENQVNRPLPSRFFRKNLTVDDIFELAEKDLRQLTSDEVIELNTQAGTCNESCEAFMD